MKKSTEKLELTKEKIRIATLGLMKKCRDPSEVTSRAIAAAADVQLAMINYCFGSREALLFEVYTRFYVESADVSAIMTANIPPKEKLKLLHYNVADFLIENFAFAKAVTGYVLLNRDLSGGTTGTPLVIAHYDGRKSENECKLIAYELSSVMQLFIMRHEVLKDFCGFDLSDKAQLKACIDMQIDLFLTD